MFFPKIDDGAMGLRSQLQRICEKQSEPARVDKADKRCSSIVFVQNCVLQEFTASLLGSAEYRRAWTDINFARLIRVV
jgi:hypothetical protein